MCASCISHFFLCSLTSYWNSFAGTQVDNVAVIYLSLCPRLKTLNLKGCRSVSTTAMPSLKTNCPELIHIDVRDTGVTIAHINALKTTTSDELWWMRVMCEWAHASQSLCRVCTRTKRTITISLEFTECNRKIGVILWSRVCAVKTLAMCGATTVWRSTS